MPRCPPGLCVQIRRLLPGPNIPTQREKEGAGGQPEKKGWREEKKERKKRGGRGREANGKVLSQVSFV